MHLIVYMSQYLGDSNSMFSDIRDIIEVSKANNPSRGITGILLYHQGKFVQVLEGEESDLRDLMKKIEKDPRHENLEYLLDEKTTQRGFMDWNMDFFNLTEKDSLDSSKMKEISKLYRSQPMVRSDKLVKMYEDLLKDGVFQEV